MGDVSFIGAIGGTGDMPDHVREAINNLFGIEPETPARRKLNLRGAITGMYAVVITDGEGNQYQIELNNDILATTIAERDDADFHAGAIEYLNSRAQHIVRGEMRNGAVSVEIYRFDKGDMVKKIEPNALPDISSLTQDEWEEIIVFCAKDGMKNPDVWRKGIGGWQRFYAERIFDHYIGATEDEIFVAISEADSAPRPTIDREELAQALAFKFHKSPDETPATTASDNGGGQMTQQEWERAIATAREKWCEDIHGKKPAEKERWAEWEADYIRANYRTQLPTDVIANVIRAAWEKWGWSWVSYAATELAAKTA